jgi:hypothetical protein
MPLPRLLIPSGRFICDQDGAKVCELYGLDAEPTKRALVRRFNAYPTVVAALRTLLDQVDYTRGACGPTEQVAACLPKEVIAQAQAALAAVDAPASPGETQ